jgi:hypothetical protein
MCHCRLPSLLFVDHELIMKAGQISHVTVFFKGELMFQKLPFVYRVNLVSLRRENNSH